MTHTAKPTLAEVRDAIERAHGYTFYTASTNETIGPHNCRNLSGPSTSRKYDSRRAWNTSIAIALAEEAFDCDLSQHEIVDSGPWRETVRSIHTAIHAEIAADETFERDCDNEAAK